MIKKELTDEEIFTRLDNFFRENRNLLTEEEEKLVRKTILWGRKNSLTYELTRQVSDEIGILDDETNIYLGFAKLLKDNFNIDRDVIEIGSGKLPSLSRKIRGLQTKGNVTVYDPILTKKDYQDKHLILKREMFSDDIKLSKDTLIVSFMPCEYTRELLEYIGREKLDFMIALCGCNHNYTPYADFDDTLYDWYGNMEYLARRGIDEGNLGEFGRTYLKEYDNPYPILYNKRK